MYHPRFMDHSERYTRQVCVMVVVSEKQVVDCKGTGLFRRGLYSHLERNTEHKACVADQSPSN